MNIEQELNHKQYLAASSQAKHLRIVAGAGTGKTRTLTYRLAYQILCGINPKKMVAITFTNKAAKEMLTRVEALLEREQVTKKFQAVNLHLPRFLLSFFASGDHCHQRL